MSERLVFPRAQQGFLVLSYPRCGSHMLQSALNAHPDITCHDEVFNPDVVPMVGHSSIAQRLGQFWDGPLTGVLAHAYIGWNGKRGPWTAKPIFTKLFARLPADTTVICLQRWNLLHRHVSHLVAKERRAWTFNKGAQPKVMRVTVDPGKFKQDVESTREIYGTLGSQFVNTHLVTYEQLCDQLPRHMRRIYEHLGADPAKCDNPQVGTVRLGTVALRKQVANYDALKKQFANTSMRRYFDE